MSAPAEILPVIGLFDFRRQSIHFLSAPASRESVTQSRGIPTVRYRSGKLVSCATASASWRPSAASHLRAVIHPGFPAPAVAAAGIGTGLACFEAPRAVASFTSSGEDWKTKGKTTSVASAGA